MNNKDQKLRTKSNSEQNISDIKEDPPDLRLEKKKQFSPSNEGLNSSDNESYSNFSFIIPLNSKNNQIKENQDFFSQYKVIKNILQFNLNEIEKQNERNSKNWDDSDTLGKISGRINIKTPEDHEIPLFLQHFSSTNYCRLYKIDIFRLFKEKNDSLIYLREDLIKFFISKNFTEPFIFIFPLDELEYYSREEISLIYSIFKITEHFAPISLGGIFLFISSRNQNISYDYNNFFDLELNLQIPDTRFKKFFIESIFKDIPNNSVDVEHISLQMKDWNVAAIRKFLIFAYRYFQINQMDDLTNKIKFNTHFLSELIENNSINFRNISIDNSNTIYKSDAINSEPHLSDPKIMLNENFEHQLYQEAASKDYEDLCIILDKIQKGIVLLPFERLKLADNSFILKDDPKKALQKLNKAKVIVDKFKKIIS